MKGVTVKEHKRGFVIMTLIFGEDDISVKEEVNHYLEKFPNREYGTEIVAEERSKFPAGYKVILRRYLPSEG